jgi:cytochrome P450
MDIICSSTNDFSVHSQTFLDKRFYPVNCVESRDTGFWGRVNTFRAAEPGEPYLCWLRQYRNPIGLISFPFLFYTRRVMTTSSSAIQHVLNKVTIYIRPEFEHDTLKNILGDGLLTAEGKLHNLQRKMLNPAFTPGYIRDIVPIFSKKAEDLVITDLEQLRSQNDEGIVEILWRFLGMRLVRS